MVRNKGKKRTYLTDMEIENLLDDIIAGLNRKTIAAKYDVNQATVSKYSRMYLDMSFTRKPTLFNSDPSKG